jgi:7-cyano-7-deazaguanosine (preQ0) biosynthesis protein QueE
VTGPLLVSEIFGPTVQGEGPSIGRRAGFIRLGRCNLSCEWCDSRYTWDWAHHDPATELSTWTTDAVLRRLTAMAVELVVITGGEPLLQQPRLIPLLEGCSRRGWQVEVETNGTVRPALPPGLVSQWNVSPKLANSAVAIGRRLRPEVLAAFEETGHAVFKFVATSVTDLDEIRQVVEQCGLSTVYVMPEGTDSATLTGRLEELGDAVLAQGWRLTTRLHILLWGNRRGV